MSTLTAQATNNSSNFKKLLSTMKGHLYLAPHICCHLLLLAAYYWHLR